MFIRFLIYCTLIFHHDCTRDSNTGSIMKLFSYISQLQFHTNSYYNADVTPPICTLFGCHAASSWVRPGPPFGTRSFNFYASRELGNYNGFSVRVRFLGSFLLSNISPSFFHETTPTRRISYGSISFCSVRFFCCLPIE